MPNTVACPDSALEKCIQIDSTEDPTAFIRLLEMKITLPLDSRPAANAKMTYKPSMTIDGKPFSDQSYAVQLLGGSIYLNLC